MIEEGWLTTAEAIARASCSDRKLQRLVRDGLLEARIRPGKPTLYSAAGIAALASAPRSVHRPAISLADGTNGHGNGYGALTKPPGNADGQLVATLVRFIEAIDERLTANALQGPTGPTPLSEVSHLTILSLAQAEAEIGWPRKELRRFIAEGKLVPVCGRSSRSWRVRRKDVEAL